MFYNFGIREWKFGMAKNKTVESASFGFPFTADGLRAISHLGDALDNCGKTLQIGFAQGFRLT